MLERLQKVFNKVTGKTNVILSPQTKLDSGIGLTSFILISLVASAEDEFGISIPNSEIKKFKTVEDILRFIEKSSDKEI